MPHFCSCGADTYICQVCGEIKCSKDYPSTWRTDLTGTENAGNVCPSCLKENGTDQPLDVIGAGMIEGVLVDDSVKRYVLAGNATFTLKNPKSGNRFTYKVKNAERDPEHCNTFFVSTLTGPDNERHYSYIGFITRKTSADDYVFIYGGRKAKLGPLHPQVRGFQWFFKYIENPEPIEVWHVGKCGRCGRALTVPESIERGIGPECERIMESHGTYHSQNSFPKVVEHPEILFH